MPATTRARLAVLFSILALVPTGRLSGQGPDAPAKPAATDRVYFLRGWANIYSRGLDAMAGTLNAQGIPAEVWAYGQGRQVTAAALADRQGRTKPLVLVGHSYGAEDMIRVAQDLRGQGVTVDLLVTLDPANSMTVPANVKRTVNIYRPKQVLGRLPYWRGVPLSHSGTGTLENINIRERPDLNDSRITHGNMTENAGIQSAVLAEIRATWGQSK